MPCVMQIDVSGGDPIVFCLATADAPREALQQVENAIESTAVGYRSPYLALDRMEAKNAVPVYNSRNELHYHMSSKPCNVRVNKAAITAIRCIDKTDPDYLHLTQ